MMKLVVLGAALAAALTSIGSSGSASLTVHAGKNRIFRLSPEAVAPVVANVVELPCGTNC